MAKVKGTAEFKPGDWVRHIDYPDPMKVVEWDQYLAEHIVCEYKSYGKLCQLSYRMHDLLLLTVEDIEIAKRDWDEPGYPEFYLGENLC